MSTGAYRRDAVASAVPVIVEDCAHCGADVNLAGKCSAKCEASRRADAARAKRTERMG